MGSCFIKSIIQLTSTASSASSTATQMSPYIYILYSPLLHHDHPATNLLKGPRALPVPSYAAPGLAFLDPQQEVLLGLDNFEINTPSTTVARILSQEEPQILRPLPLCPLLP